LTGIAQLTTQAAARDNRAGHRLQLRPWVTASQPARSLPGRGATPRHTGRGRSLAARDHHGRRALEAMLDVVGDDSAPCLAIS
jgi:hypothetical protein